MLDFQRLFESIPGMYLVMDLQVKVVAASDAYLHTLGCDRQDIVDQDLLALYSCSDSGASSAAKAERLSHSIRQVLKENVSHTLPPQQYRLCPDGDPYWKIIHSPIHDATGQITHIVQCIENVSSMMQMQQRLETVLENISDAFAVYDHQWNITYINARGAGMAGMDPEDLVGKNLWQLFPKAMESDYYRALQRAMVDREPTKVEIFYQPWQRWFESRAYPCPEGLLLFSTDITERKQTALQLRRSETRFRQMAETIPSVFWLQDVTHQRILYVSPAYETIWGRDSEALYDDVQLWQESIHPEHREQLQQAAQNCLEHGHSEEEYRIIRPDGTVRWIRDRGYVVPAQPGQAQTIAGVAEDITEQKQAQAALRNQERKFRRLMDSNIFGVVFGDCCGGLSYMNDYMLNLLGYSRETVEAGELRWDQLTPPEFASADEQALQQLQAHGFCAPYEKEYFHREGHRIPVLVGTSLLAEESSGPSCSIQQEAVAFVIDLSSLKQISEERDRFFNSASDLLAIANLDGYFTQVNPAWQTVLGWTEAEMTSQAYFDLIHPDDVDKTKLEAQAVAEGKELIGFENRYRSKDGSYRWLAWNVTPIPERQKLYAAARDITESKKIEQERDKLLTRELAARAKAETANRMKDEFLAVISHELRTPLNPILGWTEILLRRAYDEAQTRKGLETIQRNATLQATLVEDLLDVSRILRGKLVLNNTPVEMEAIIRAAMETVQFSAEAKEIEMQLQISDLPMIRGDRDRLQQVIWNLLSNAIKFTPEQGKIEILARQTEADEQGRSQIEVSVIDNGRGIEAEFIPFIFESFRQEDLTITRNFSGLGLGLSIVRHIVELHGGKISVASLGRDQGATFTLQLPITG